MGMNVKKLNFLVTILDFCDHLEFEIWVRAKFKNARSSTGSVKVKAYSENLQKNGSSTPTSSITRSQPKWIRTKH